MHCSRSRAVALALIVAACGGGGGSSAPAVMPELALESVGGTFFEPVFVSAPAGDPRLFVVEKVGTIRVVENGSTLPTPFLDLTGQVSTGIEQGLLGLAFDPLYATNGRFYVDYVNLDGRTQIVRYRVSAGDPNVADPASAESLRTIPRPIPDPQLDPFHNGGMIAFGRDGYLYIATGDGNAGTGGDGFGTGQSLDDLLGSLLRIDVRNAPGYVVPPDNPFVATPNAQPEVWSRGLRNPWRFSFDRQSGDLYIGDVGQDSKEEIDVSSFASGGGRAANYGWNITEGSDCFQPPSGCATSGLVPPLVEFDHSGGECSVIGGYVYRGSAVPELRGTYFYADFCAQWIKSFRLSGGQATQRTDWPNLFPGGSVVSFGEDGFGELYIVTLGGGVYRIIRGP